MRKFVLTLIRVYQVLSGAKSPSCRYLPTCSQYTYEAIEKNGFFEGVCLGVKRLGRCHPLHKGGYDPVP